MSNVIHSENEIGQSDLTGNETDAILEFLRVLDGTKESINYLEIGICGAKTMSTVKSTFPKVKLSGIDFFEDYVPVDTNTHVSGTWTLAVTQKYLGEDAKLYKGDSAVVVPTLPDTYDFIFIDGNHKYDATKVDFHNCVYKLNPGGYIAFHNCSAHMQPECDIYNPVDGGPRKVTEEIINNDARFKMVKDIDRIRVFQRV
jgi:hypothetical protein